MDNRYGDAILCWYDFKAVLDEFAAAVANKRYEKMEYSMWRRIAKSRPDKDEVVVSWDCEGVTIYLPDEEEKHYFVWDSGFAKFLWNERIEFNWSKWNDIWGDGYTVYKAPPSISVDTYTSMKNLNIDTTKIKEAAARAESVLNNVGVSIKNAAVASTSALAATSLGISAASTDGISCRLDTKVDKDELDARLDELVKKIENVNKKNEENVNMKAFNFDFGPVNGNAVRMSMYGLAVKNKTGTFVSYDAKAGEIMDVDVFNFDGANFLYKMPVAMKDIAVGDVVIHHGAPMFVVGKSTDGKGLVVIDVIAGERKEVMLAKSPFGFNFATKVVNFLGNAFNGNVGANADNPFGNMWMLMAMSGDNKDMNEMLPFMMMANGGNIDSNMLMFMAMSGKGNNDMLPMLMMMNAANASAPAHNCDCGCGEHHN